jgi:hypothetical protein
MKHHVISEDPDMEKSTKELILLKGYPVEEHYVLTEDGFFLGLQVGKNLCDFCHFKTSKGDTDSGCVQKI